jgi:uncharacterized phage protein (TIGR01671 family)
MIKFRGLTESGEWVYGSFAYHKPFKELRTYIKPKNTGRIELIEVIPSTVGQFTGLKDKNGNEIYEGDILNSTFGDGNSSTIFFGEYFQDEDHPNASSIGFYFKDPDGDEYGFGKSTDGNTDAYEVIGNIHENPELLKSEVV